MCVCCTTNVPTLLLGGVVVLLFEFVLYTAVGGWRSLAWKRYALSAWSLLLLCAEFISSAMLPVGLIRVGIAHCCHATIDGNDYCVASFTNVGIGML
jgi:hypothetical protein